MMAAGMILFSLYLNAQRSYDPGPEPVDADYYEELYVATDRDLYIAGEEVYIKIYSFSRITGSPGGLSSVAYIDMHDSFNIPACQIKVKLDGFSGAGVIRLPDTLRTGSYYIRTFTNLMKNFPPEFFAYRKISVINPYENISRIMIPDRSGRTDSVMFFPATGCLVQGIENRIGLRSFNSKGEPVKISGVIVDAKNDTLSSVSTDVHGTGIFSILPPTTGSLFLVTDFRETANNRFPLPEITANGISFSVDDDKKSGFLRIKILKNGNSTVKTGKLTVTYSPLHITSASGIIQAEADSLVTFKKNSLPQGLAEIKVTDQDGRLLANSHYYNDRSSEITYSMQLSKEHYSAREKVTVEITARDHKGDAVVSNLHASVFRPISSDMNYNNDIMRYVQLPGAGSFHTDLHLPGINDYLIFIPEIGSVSPSIERDNSASGLFLPEINGFSLNGLIMDSGTGDPVKNEKISLGFIGKTARCKFTNTDKNGCFSFISDEYGKKELVIQPVLQTHAGYFVELVDPFPENIRKFAPAPFYIDTTDLDAINKSIISSQVRNVYDQFRKPSFKKSDIDVKRHFYGDPERKIQLSEYIELKSFKEVIKELVPGLSTVTRNDRTSFRLINKYPNQSFESAPLVILDGIPVYDFDKVLKIKSSELDYLEVLNVRYFMGDNIIDGIINIISRKGDLGALEFDLSTFRQEYDCLQEDYLPWYPDYSEDSLKMSPLPDFRNTLYWNPDLKTDVNGHASFEFYTSDESGEFVIEIEGFAHDGSAGRAETVFIVNDQAAR